LFNTAEAYNSQAVIQVLQTHQNTQLLTPGKRLNFK